MSCGADTDANTLLASLLQGKSFDLPDVDLSGDLYKVPDGTGELYVPPSKLTNADLTTGQVDGTGVFDTLMTSIAAHLKKEYEANRITGNEYTKAYTGIVGGALATAVQYLLGKDQAYWQAILSQQQARAAEIATVTARVQLETAKAQLATTRLQALTAEAEYGLTKIRIANEDAQYCLTQAQTSGVELDNTAKTYTNTNLLPSQKALLEAQVVGQTTQNTGLGIDNQTKTYTLSNIMPSQNNLLKEQIEVQRAQTLDTRVDGQQVRGSVGKQKDLYTQQITSYERDAEVKAAKMFVDAWITQKTIDEGLTAPNGFTNASLDTILSKLKANNDLN